MKIHILENNIQDIFRFFSNKLNMIRRRYSRQLPYHVVESEADDLDVIAQLELVETIKVWNSIEDEDEDEVRRRQDENSRELED